MSDPSDQPSPELLALLRDIDSVEAVEVLLLLARRPEEAFTVEEISAELRSSNAAIKKRLGPFVDRGVVERSADGRHRYAPRDPRITRVVEELARLYRDRPYRVMDLVFSKPLRDVQSFADAFRLKKKKDG